MAVSSKAVALSDLKDQESLNAGLQLYMGGYPIMKSYCSNEGVGVIRSLEEIFGSKKKVLSYITSFEATPDKGDYERFLRGGKISSFLKLMGLERVKVVYQIAKDREISIHDFYSNMAKVHENDNAEELFEFIKRIMGYNVGSLMEMLGFMNYKKIRNAQNLEEMRKHTSIVKAARAGMQTTHEIPGYLALMNVQSDTKLRFTKDPLVIATIGRETLCCFTKDGLAAALLNPAQKSPISGIIDGTIENKRWFSFVWELVEKQGNAESGWAFEKNLVLDNIEAKGMISAQGSDVIWSRLKYLDGYKRIYCGTSRNDVTFQPQMTTSSKSKPRNLIGYEKAWEKYGSFDDSRNLYTVDEKTDSVKAVIHRMNPGDLHRAKFVESYIYGENADPDFLDINVYASPSYIIESDTHIYGYFVTRLKYYPADDEKFGQKQDINGKALKEWKKKNRDEGKEPYEGLQKVLYLEDIYSLPYRKCKASFRHAFDDLLQWIRDEGIVNVSANTNEYSEPFVKRVKEAGLNYVEQTNMGAFRPNSTFVSKGVASLEPSEVEVSFGEWVVKEEEEESDGGEKEVKESLESVGEEPEDEEFDDDEEYDEED